MKKFKNAQVMVEKFMKKLHNQPFLFKKDSSYEDGNCSHEYMLSEHVGKIVYLREFEFEDLNNIQCGITFNKKSNQSDESWFDLKCFEAV